MRRLSPPSESTNPWRGICKFELLQGLTLSLWSPKWSKSASAGCPRGLHEIYISSSSCSRGLPWVCGRQNDKKNASVGCPRGVYEVWISTMYGKAELNLCKFSLRLLFRIALNCRGPHAFLIRSESARIVYFVMFTLPAVKRDASV